MPDYSGVTSLFIDPFGYIYPSDVWDLKIGRLQKIKDWSKFSEQVRQKILSERPPVSWMICTARQAMRKHWLEVGWWILRIKFLTPKAKRYIFQRHRIASGHGSVGKADGERAIRSSKIPRWGILR